MKNLVYISLFLFSNSLYSKTPQELEQLKRRPKPIGQAKAAEMLNSLRTEAHMSRSSGKDFPKWAGGQSDGLNGPLFLHLRKMCAADEEQFVQVERSLIKDWIVSWSSKNPSTFLSHLSNKAEIENFSSSGKEKKLDTIKLTKWAEETGTLSNKESITSSIDKYLSSFSRIEDFNLTASKYNSPKMYRDQNLSMKEFNLELAYDLRGYEGATKRQDRGHLFVTIAKEKTEWKILKIQITDMETLVNQTPSFVEKTASAGIDNLVTYQRIEAIRRGGYAIAVGDYNGDGYSDMYVGAYGPGQLFKGKADGTFEEVKKSGIDDLLYVKSAIWADLDNDGLKDLTLVRFVPGELKTTKKTPLDYLDRRTDVAIYKNLGADKFVKVDGINDKALTDYAMPAAIADFNNDGLLDIYIGYPGHKDFTTFSNYFEDKKLLKAQGVYFNKGNFKFEPGLMSELGYDQFEKYSDLQKIFPHSAMAVDFNQDGKVDIMVVDDRGNLSPAYMNLGNGKFTQANNSFNLNSQGYGMGIASSDFNNDGLTDILMTSVEFNSTKRINRSCFDNWGIEFVNNNPNHNDVLAYQGVKLAGKKSFLEVSKDIGLNDIGEGLGAVEVLDYNNDGFDDIYLVNGLWSGTDRFQDISSEFSMASFNKDAKDFDRTLMEAKRGTQSTVMSILANYTGNADGSKSKAKLSLAGFQRNRLFRNNQDGTFTEVGYMEGVDSLADGYIISKADLNHDGKMDLILRNADPGAKNVMYPPVQVFMNQNSNANSLRVKLIGSKSNTDAIGAEVTLEVKDGLVETKQLIGNAGTAQSELTLHFGLGDAETARSMTVKWPSGKISKLTNLKKGYLEVTEESSGNPISYAF